MADSDPRQPILSYARPRRRRPIAGRLRTRLRLVLGPSIAWIIAAGRWSFLWLTARPSWVIALFFAVIAAGVWVFNLLPHPDRWPWRLSQALWVLPDAVAFFLPGALGRRNKQDIYIAMICAGAWCALEAILVNRDWEAPYPYVLIYSILRTYAIVALMEWLLLRPGHSRSQRRGMLRWLLLLIPAAACAHAILQTPLNVLPSHEHWYEPGIAARLRWERIVPQLTLPCFLWVAIPAARRLAEKPMRRLSFTGAALAAGTIACFCIVFTWLAYAMARRSLVEGWPLGEGDAILILDSTRDRPEDLRLMWQALERAKWNTDDIYGGAGEHELLFKSIRRRQHHDAAFAARLSAMLREHPSRELASTAAPLFAQCRQYDAVPILVRYSLRGDWACSEALIELKIPEGAIGGLTARRYELPTMTPKQREPFAAVLGRDAGTDFAAWYDLYLEVTARDESPLPPEIRVQTARIAAASRKYNAMYSRTRFAGDVYRGDAILPRINWDAPDFPKEVDRWCAEVEAMGYTKARPDR